MVTAGVWLRGGELPTLRSFPPTQREWIQAELVGPNTLAKGRGLVLDNANYRNLRNHKHRGNGRIESSRRMTQKDICSYMAARPYTC